MNYVHAIILGLVEGATEFLPISSTFHLIWISRFLGIPETEFQKAFEVIIQGGAVLAIIFLYWRFVITNRTLLVKTLVSFLPTAVVGLVLYRLIKSFFFTNVLLQISVFVGIGVIFILFETYRGRNLTKTLSALTFGQAVMIGFIQSLAVIPGVSRAGAVMLGLMFLGMRRDEAAIYSFLLAVPTILAAAGLDFIKVLPLLSSNQANVGLLVVGFITSFISALVVIKWLISFLQKNTLIWFGWYRIISGLILIVIPN